jgi:hypothetical protein
MEVRRQNGWRGLCATVYLFLSFLSIRHAKEILVLWMTQTRLNKQVSREGVIQGGGKRRLVHI